jgi:hypothetical protein
MVGLFGAVRLAAAVVPVSAGAASATTVTSDFDAGLEGWTASGGALDAPASGGASGQPGDGFLWLDDNASTTMFVSAPSAFLNAPLLDGGVFSFDLIELETGGDPLIAGLGTVTLVSGSTSLAVDIVPTTGLSSWATYDADLTAAFWGASASEWDDILSGLDALEIELESRNGLSETIGLDNVSLTLADHPNAGAAAIPLPAAAPLLLLGLGALGLGRRRRG